MHWLTMAAGLWMATAAHANEYSQLPADVSPAAQAHTATANAALALDEAVGAGDDASAQSPGPVERDDAAQCSAIDDIHAGLPLGHTERPAQANAEHGPTLPQDAPANAAPVVAEQRHEIPRSARARAEQSAAAAPSRIERTSAIVPWYRSPYAALAGVLAIIVMLTVLARRFVPSARPIAGDVLRVVGRAPIGAKQSAVLLHVGQRLVLVGVGPDSLRTLSEITEPEEVSLLLGKVGGSSQAAQAFDTMLAEELHEYESDASSSPRDADEDVMRDSLRLTRGQLESLRTRIRSLQSA
jgi:flagellar protein FliO/FliZ